MTTADAKVELASGLRCNLDGAIGGTYRLPDGREFWIDGATVSEVLARIEPIIVSWIEAHGTILEASPNSRTEALSLAQIEAVRAVFDEDYGASGLQLAGITIDRMFLAMQVPHSRTEALTDEAAEVAHYAACMFATPGATMAGVKAKYPWADLDERRKAGCKAIATAVLDTAMQSARPIDQQETVDECLTCQGRGYIWVTHRSSGSRERVQCSDCTGIPIAPSAGR